MQWRRNGINVAAAGVANVAGGIMWRKPAACRKWRQCGNGGNVSK